jgi:hypothetical protein
LVGNGKIERRHYASQGFITCREFEHTS